jgi:hypothetical protein
MLRFSPEWVIGNLSAGVDPFAAVLEHSQKLPQP